MTSIHDWAGLPEHILDLIVSKFSRLSDYFSFPVVCSNWRNLYPTPSNFLDILKLSHKEIPMLLIKTEENDDDNRSLYNVLNGISYTIQLPLPYKYRFVGSSHGWLICLDKNIVITLLNPFNNVFITLPSFINPSYGSRTEWPDYDTFDYYIQKAILTSDPHTSPNNYEVVVIYSSISNLACYKSAHDRWYFIDLVPENKYVSMDIICYKGCIYSVTYSGELLLLDFHSGTAKTVVPKNTEEETDGFYLVESKDEELLLVKRVWHYPERDDGLEFEESFKFEVFKLKHSTYEETATWDQMNDIGDQAFFVGSTNLSICVWTLECLKFRRNSIYYTPQSYLDFPGQYEGVLNVDSGIFNLEDKSFSSHHMLGPSEKYVQPPVWIVPNQK